MFAPENTLEAALLGHRSGAFAWELDVHLSRDGVPVVVHDETLVRTTDVAKRFAGDPRSVRGFRVRDFDWNEIRSLDAGSWFVDLDARHRSAKAFGTWDQIPRTDVQIFQTGRIRIPSLEEALELTARLDWLVNVEVKSFPDPDPRLLREVLGTIERIGIEERVLLSSFDHQDIARVVREKPEIATGALSHTPLYRPERYVRQILGADYHHISIEACLASPHPPEWEDEDLKTFVYTVNDVSRPGLETRLREAGIAGIFTDDPASMVERFTR